MKSVEKNGDNGYDTLWYLRKYWIDELPALTRLRYLDFKTYLPSDNLTKVDRATMSQSVEARIPFLNREIVEYVFSLAEDEVCTVQNLKGILKSAYVSIIPEEILYRRKKGFSIPDNYIRQNNESYTKYMSILKSNWKDILEEVNITS